MRFRLQKTTYQGFVHIDFFTTYRNIEWISGFQRGEGLVARDEVMEKLVDVHVHLPYLVVDFALPCVHVALAGLLAVLLLEVVDVLFRNAGGSVGHWRR